jgi:hypothetical protein
MRILLTSLLHRTKAMETYVDDNGNQQVIWHQDTLNPALFEQIVDQHGYPDILISSAHPEYVESDLTHYYWPDDLWQIAEQIHTFAIAEDFPTEYCFNFMVNKNQTNRYLLIKLVEWFGLNSFDYTWSGASHFDCTEILDELPIQPSDLVSHMMKPGFGIVEKFIQLPAGTEPNNLAIWNHGLRQLFGKSAVSLITESVGREKLINFTEKTLFSVQALTFPIWVGGYRQAQLWADHGFDTFDDVINHDYQMCDTLVERCHRAFQDNLPILTDLKLAQQLRTQHLDRLIKNKENLRNNIEAVFLKNWHSMPDELKHSLKEMIKSWPIRASQRGFRLLNI